MFDDTVEKVGRRWFFFLLPPQSMFRLALAAANPRAPLLAAAGLRPLIGIAATCDAAVRDKSSKHKRRSLSARPQARVTTPRRASPPPVRSSSSSSRGARSAKSKMTKRPASPVKSRSPPVKSRSVACRKSSKKRLVAKRAPSTSVLRPRSPSTATPRAVRRPIVAVATTDPLLTRDAELAAAEAAEEDRDDDGDGDEDGVDADDASVQFDLGSVRSELVPQWGGTDAAAPAGSGAEHDDDESSSDPEAQHHGAHEQRADPTAAAPWLASSDSQLNMIGARMAKRRAESAAHSHSAAAGLRPAAWLIPSVEPKYLEPEVDRQTRLAIRSLMMYYHSCIRYARPAQGSPPQQQLSQQSQQQLLLDHTHEQTLTIGGPRDDGYSNDSMFSANSSAAWSDTVGLSALARRDA